MFSKTHALLHNTTVVKACIEDIEYKLLYVTQNNVATNMPSVSIMYTKYRRYVRVGGVRYNANNRRNFSVYDLKK